MTEKDKGEDRGAHRQPDRECPICGKPVTPEAYPFCSRRCANVDLNRWLSDAYVIPGSTAAETTENSED